MIQLLPNVDLYKYCFMSVSVLLDAALWMFLNRLFYLGDGLMHHCLYYIKALLT